jgi:hypothetical protein
LPIAKVRLWFESPSSSNCKDGAKTEREREKKRSCEQKERAAAHTDKSTQTRTHAHLVSASPHLERGGDSIQQGISWVFTHRVVHLQEWCKKKKKQSKQKRTAKADSQQHSDSLTHSLSLGSLTLHAAGRNWSLTLDGGVEESEPFLSLAQKRKMSAGHCRKDQEKKPAKNKKVVTTLFACVQGESVVQGHSGASLAEGHTDCGLKLGAGVHRSLSLTQSLCPSPLFFYFTETLSERTR